MIGMVPVTFLAIVFFDFNLWGSDSRSAAFFANLLLTSWAIGISGRGPDPAQRHGRGGARLDDHVPACCR